VGKLREFIFKNKKKMIWWASHKKCLKTKIINVVLHYLVDLSEPKKKSKN